MPNANESLTFNEGKIYTKVCSNCHEEFSFRHKSKKIPGSGKPDLCPNCGDKYWDKPRDEAVLQKLQDEFIDSGRDPEVLSLMYPELVNYAKNFIKGIMKNKRILEKDVLDEKAHDAACKIVERLLGSPDYIVHSSFGGNLSKILKGVLFGDAKFDQMSSLDSVLNVGNDSFSLNHYSDSDSSVFVNHSTMKDNPDMYEQKMIDTEESIVEEIEKILEKIGAILRETSPGRPLLFYAGIYGFFNKKNVASMNMFYATYGNDLQDKVEKAKIFIRKYLLEMEIDAA